VSLSGFSIKRPVGISMIVLIFTVIGMVSLTNIAVDWLPEIAFPMVAVLAQYEEAAPQEVEEQITEILEGIIAAADEVNNVSSVSMSGMCLIMAEFGWGSNMTVAGQNIREKIDTVRDFLPRDMSPPLVMKFDPSQMPILYYGLTSEVSPINDLKKYAEDVIRPRLEGVDGVALVGVLGGLEEEILVEVDRDKLDLYRVSLLQLVNAIRLENLNLSGGHMDIGSQEYLIRTVGQFATVEDVGNVVVAVSQDGSPIFIKDVARVVPTHVEPRSYVRMDGRDSIGIPVLRQSGTNTVLVANAVGREMNAIKMELPSTIRITSVFDLAEFINMSLDAIKMNAVVGSVFAFFMLIFFLHDSRASVIIFISVPVCIVATFMLMYFGKVTANMMSLGGFALGLGILVDNAIIVLENTYRHLESGKDSHEASETGAREVGMAVTASTLTTIAVFFPIAFIKGLAGQLFKDMAVTVSFSLTASLFLSLSLVPMLSSRLLKNRRTHRDGWILEGIREGHDVFLSWGMKHRKSTVLLVLASVGISLLPVWPLRWIPLELLPKTPGEEFICQAKLPIGTTLDVTNEIMKGLEEEIQRIPEVEHVFVSIGVSETSKYDAASGMGPQDVNEAQFFGLFYKKKAGGRPDDVVLEDVRRISERIPGLTTNVMSINDALLSSMRLAELEIKFWGEDLDKLMEITNQACQVLVHVDGVSHPETKFRLGKGEINLRVNREIASKYLVSTGAVAQTVKTAVMGSVAGRYRSGDHRADIRVKLRPDQRDRPEDLGVLKVPNPMGGAVALSVITEIEEGKAPARIFRDRQRRVGTVEANLRGGGFFLGDTVQGIREALDRMGLPRGYVYTIEGQWKELQIAMRSMAYAFVMAVILVYMIMAFQFESLIHPLVVMVAVPLASIGVVLSLLFFGKTMCVTAFIGIIMLVGIAVNDAIVLIDFIRQLREAGLERNEAILTAGSRRVRPILLTTLTTCVGMLPTALSIGGRGSALQAPLAAAVIGGLFTSTLLTLVVIPVFYSIADDWGIWIKKQLLGKS